MLHITFKKNSLNVLATLELSNVNIIQPHFLQRMIWLQLPVDTLCD